jgi:hypothetical protein
MNEVSPISEGSSDSAEPAFIPVSRSDIMGALLHPDLWESDSQRAMAAEVLHKIGLLRQYLSSVQLNELSEVYDPFNPDDETINVVEASEMERLEKRRVLNAKMRELVTSANYRELGQPELEEILTQASPDGVHVDCDFREYEIKLMFYRGESQTSLKRRDIKKLFLRHLHYQVPIFERLFLAVKFKPEEERLQEIMQEEQLDEAKARKKLKKLRRMLPPSFSTDHVYIKVFKDIPRYDVEMLFPNIRVKMKYRDKLQLGGSAVVGTLTWAIGTGSKLLALVAISPLVLAGALVTGVGGIMYAQVRNVFITRDKYRMLLAQRLYFQNLSNNQGALALMVDEAEEEDVKEEALLYVHLLQTPVHFSQIDAVRARINTFLSDRFGITVRFDVKDALSRLVSLGLVHQSSSGDLRVVPLEHANQNLRTVWQRLCDRR